MTACAWFSNPAFYKRMLQNREKKGKEMDGGGYEIENDQMQTNSKLTYK